MFERFTSSARRTVRRAAVESQALKSPSIRTEHLLLGLLDESAGLGHEILFDAGLRYDTTRAEILRRTARDRLSDDDAAALRSIGIDLDEVRARLEESFGPDALRAPEPPVRRGLFRRAGAADGRFRRRLDPAATKTIELALRQALSLRDSGLGSEHLLLGLLQTREGIGGQILWSTGLTLTNVRNRVRAANRAA